MKLEQQLLQALQRKKMLKNLEDQSRKRRALSNKSTTYHLLTDELQYDIRLMIKRKK